MLLFVFSFFRFIYIIAKKRKIGKTVARGKMTLPADAVAGRERYKSSICLGSCVTCHGVLSRVVS